jgi:hypothetical protein
LQLLNNSLLPELPQSQIIAVYSTLNISQTARNSILVTPLHDIDIFAGQTLQDILSRRIMSKLKTKQVKV